MAHFSSYILRRWAAPLLGALFFYGCLMVAQNMVVFSKEIFEQGAPLRWLIPLLGTALPEILAMVLPMAAVLGGLMGTQALMEGSELTAAQGLGVGPGPWMRPFALLAALLVGLGLLNSNYLVPATLRAQQSLKQRMLQEAKARILRPGGAPWYPPKERGSALWADEQGRLHLLESEPGTVRHVVADRFSYALGAEPDGAWTFHVEMNGIKGVVINEKARSILHINQASQVIDQRSAPSGRLLSPTRFRDRGSAELWRNGSWDALLEAQRRVALPLAAAALLLLGVALGFGHPRFHRGGAVLKSMGVILVYYLFDRALEGALQGGKAWALPALLALPFGFGLWGALLFRKRLMPHRASHGHRGWRAQLQRISAALGREFRALKSRLQPSGAGARTSGGRGGVLERWAGRAWMRQWAAALGSLCLLVFLVEYANLAEDLSANRQSFLVFARYFFWKLPTLLPMLLPVSFLLGSVLALSDWGLSQEWVGLRAGGVSLVRLLWSLRWAWALALGGAAACQILWAPVGHQRARVLWHRIVDRPFTAQARPWLHLGQTGVLWHLDGERRWGFPLKAPGEAPVLLRWEKGDAHSEALPWGESRWVQGPEAERLFPAQGLRRAAEAEEAATWDLLQWQRWAPDPERAYLLWSRLLGWLAGPVLLLAALPFAFPRPRQGRGSALGLSLVVALVFMGLQALFSGAARAAEIPAPWGVLAPYLFLTSFFFIRMRQVRT